MNQKPLLVTAALPYANGPIHLGHLVEYTQADIFTRFQKMRGREAYYFCADDTHGAPIMIRAKNEGVAPEAVIARYHQEHQRDFNDFNIAFDHYYSTNSPENRALAEEIYGKLKTGGHIHRRPVEQAYCEHDRMFLPDRFVRGVCPRCGADDQYGDVCESCGAHYSPTELKNPRCSLCGAPPARKSSEHLFFRVADYLDTLKTFMDGPALQPEVKNFLATWLKEGLRDWDISRDGPYFGFSIPGEQDKYFYVWLDAPVGYLATMLNKFGAERFDALLRRGEGVLRHFIGKDIVYFHTLFWIPMLAGAGFTLPSTIQVHGFLTVNGEKMSKSKGTFINARTYLNHLGPEYLRYYYASKLKSGVDDLDLNFQDFVFRVNAELVNKVANLGSRTIGMLNKIPALANTLSASHILSEGREEAGLLTKVMAEAESIAADYDNLDFALALQKIMRLADLANEYIDSAKPWACKEDTERQRDILTAGINAFMLIAKYLKPVVPAFAEKVERILKIAPLKWDSYKDDILCNHTIGQFERLADRIDIALTEKIVEETQKAAEAAKKPETPAAPGAPLIEYDDFAKLDLRTAKVTAAERLPKADKLLKLTIDVGGETRTLVAGIAKHYTAEEMVGKTIIIVANLKPRALMGVTSQGMALAVNDGGTLVLLAPEKEMLSGLKVS
ncbi:MAG: methionine--tRNA ligase [Nitrospinae bacterium]|nr:methionine--tRNA ligase [Nitrospinota bacterium]